MKTKQVVGSLTLLAMAIGWYLFWPMLVELRNEFGLERMLVAWFFLSSITFICVTVLLVFDKILKSDEYSLSGVFADLKVIGVKRFVIMAVFCLMASPPSEYVISGLCFHDTYTGGLNGWHSNTVIDNKDLIIEGVTLNGR